ASKDYHPQSHKEYSTRLSGNYDHNALDILYEIFCYLHPQDVLHLSRTTKQLRGILMTKNARFVWKAAFSTARGLPQCPSDLTEPQYASLAFDEHCHVSGAYY
ncbi:hypothetical protein BDQ17DRAFT_1238061, partial [Cyathus striatus]